MRYDVSIISQIQRVGGVSPAFSSGCGHDRFGAGRRNPPDVRSAGERVGRESLIELPVAPGGGLLALARSVVVSDDPPAVDGEELG